MHFFKGIAGEMVEDGNEEDSWKGEKFMNIKDVITIIEKSRPFDEDIKEYREMQLRLLKELT